MPDSILTIYYRCLCGQVLWYTTARLSSWVRWSGWCHTCERHYKVTDLDCSVNKIPAKRWVTPLVHTWDYVTSGVLRRRKKRLKGQ